MLRESENVERIRLTNKYSGNIMKLSKDSQ